MSINTRVPPPFSVQYKETMSTVEETTSGRVWVVLAVSLRFVAV